MDFCSLNVSEKRHIMNYYTADILQCINARQPLQYSVDCTHPLLGICPHLSLLTWAHAHGFDGVWHMGHIPSTLFPCRSWDHSTQARPPPPSLWYGSKHWTTLGRMQRFYRPWGTEKSQRLFRSYSTAKTLKTKCKLKLPLWRSGKCQCVFAEQQFFTSQSWSHDIMSNCRAHSMLQWGSC